LKNIKSILKFIGLYNIFVIIFDNINLFFCFLKCALKVTSLPKSCQRFLFFPHYSTGGAQQVHIDILKAIKSLNPVVFITSDSNNSHFRDDFYKYSKCFEILPFVKKKLYKKILSYVIIKTINSRKNAYTLGGNSLFYYQLLPKIKSKRVKRMDLLHAFTDKNEPGAEKWSLPVVPYLDKRVVISAHLKNLLVNQYRNNGLAGAEEQKIEIIYNKTNNPKDISAKTFDNKLNIIYLGRNSKEKRVPLILKIAEKLQYINNFNFSFAGFEKNEIDLKYHKLNNCKFLGVIIDSEKMNELLLKAHILLLVSKSEGLPLVISEALSSGVINISTNVGAIPELITDGQNGYLFDSNLSNEELVDLITNKIMDLNKDRETLKRLSNNCLQYSNEQYLKSDFEKKYNTLLKI